ncbi:MAG TPA: membrane protein insertase YidC [Halothiobacillus sp.]|jgi:YidC/Oxa1 family membrane protein insertase|nr:membrane protein insertase YidC [Halothiobacillus sp.]HQS28539.1 membrane protein insertase YidC [Halothiobacillus sp.]
MDNRRLILVVALGFVFILLWQAWTKDQQHAMQAAATQAQSMPTSAIPEQTLNLPNALPIAATPNTPVAANTVASAPQITVRTDVLSLKINPQGGVIDTADLLSYPQEQDKAEPVNLLSDSNGFVYVAQSGLLGSKGSPAPDHYAEFQSAQTEYQLQPGQNELRIPLTWEKDGIKITKWFIVKRGDYAIKVEYQIDNTSNQPWQASQYRQLTRLGTTPGTQLVHTYTGGVYAGDIPGSKDRLAYEKVTFEDMAKANLSKALSNGWVAIIEHYFMSAWVPANPQQVNNFYTLVSAKNNQTLYTIGMSSPVDTIAAGAKGELSSTLYVGPKIQSNLAPLAQGLNLTIDYGIFTVIADPIFWLLKHFHEWVGNWGWAIVLVTLVIKIFFLWPSAISYRSMAKMRAVTPKMQQLKERFGEDRQKLSQEMMKLYQKEKINPLGGCLPIVIQIPVFISLYWVLAESVELRQAPWIFWIHDLSQKDPYFVLPLLMGISMFIQQKLNPAPVDPMQQKIFAWLPVIFTIFFSFFPAGLVLYWFVNNLLSIAQQYTITRQIEKQMALAKTD